MPIIEDKKTAIITTQNPDVVLDPDSMVDGAPLKTTSADLYKKLDALIEDVEKNTSRLKKEEPESSMYCDLYFCNKADKKFKLHGPVEELEISLPHRVTVCIQVPITVVEYFMKFCISSCFGSSKNKVLLEHCETSTSSKKTKKVVLFTKHAKGFRRNYLQLDFFKTRKSLGGKTLLDLEFISV